MLDEVAFDAAATIIERVTALEAEKDPASKDGSKINDWSTEGNTKLRYYYRLSDHDNKIKLCHVMISIPKVLDPQGIVHVQIEIAGKGETHEI